MNQPNYHKIFLFNSYGIGDFVMFLPTLFALRRGLPDSRLNLNVSNIQFQLAKSLEKVVIDELTLQKSRNRLLDVLLLLGEIKRYKPDLFVELTARYNFPLFGMTSASKELHQCEEDTPKYLRRFKVERLQPSQSKHRVDRYLQLLNYLGISHREISFDFPIQSGELESVLGIIGRYNQSGRRLISVIPESNQSWKNWPIECLRNTLDILVHDMGFGVVVFGKYASDTLRDDAVLDLRGKTTITQDANILRYGNIFDMSIGVDTGMMHVAGSVNSDKNGDYSEATKGNLTVSLFGPTDSERYRPYDPTRRLNMVVQAPLESNVRFDDMGAVLNKNSSYMQKITPEMVLSKVQQHLQNIKRIA